jgi:hypothetical protein
MMSYHLGLIAGQFMSIVQRFASLLRYIVEDRNDGAILLGSRYWEQNKVEDDEVPTSSPNKLLIN